jgi:hypothetical protein
MLQLLDLDPDLERRSSLKMSIRVDPLLDRGGYLQQHLDDREVGLSLRPV